MRSRGGHQGHRQRLRQSGCALIGGETAEMPGLYARLRLRSCGFRGRRCGTRRTLLPRPGLRAGDAVFGLPSPVSTRTAIRSCDGWSSVPVLELGRAGAVRLRRVARVALLPRRGSTCGRYFGRSRPPRRPRARPHHWRRISRQSAARSRRGTFRPAGLDAFSPPPVFSLAGRHGGIAEDEMLRTFNCGFGMAVFASKEREAETREVLALAGLEPTLVGRLVSSRGPRVVTEGRLRL